MGSSIEIVPAWLAASDRYEPALGRGPRGRGRFVEESLLSILSALSALRERPSAVRRRERLRPELKLASAFLIILLVSLSRSLLFIEAATACELVLLCLLPGELVARILRKVLAAGLFALAIFLPAFVAGSGPGVPILLAKVLLAMLAAALFSATTPWPSVTEAFAALRVPDLFVMTLDMAVKYIHLLGGLLGDMLQALKLRSVGRDERRMNSLGSLAGKLFLKSKEAVEIQAQAMECRCFSGSYCGGRRSRPSWADAVLAAADLALVAAFVLFGRAS